MATRPATRFDREAYDQALDYAVKRARRERKQIHHMRWDGEVLQFEMATPAPPSHPDSEPRSRRGLAQAELL